MAKTSYRYFSSRDPHRQPLMGNSMRGESSDESNDSDEAPWRQLARRDVAGHAAPQLTMRSALAGLAVGTLLCFTNMYFGLQTGWVTMGSVQCALGGFLLLRLTERCGGAPRGGGSPRSRRFGPLENVVIQTVGVATATLPLAGGFIGIIPALGMLSPPVVLTIPQQLAWAAALSYFGVFFAMPLRRQVILREQLPFPSGTATAKLIDLLHASASRPSLMGGADAGVELGETTGGGRFGGGFGGGGAAGGVGGGGAARASSEPRTPWRALAISFACSFGLSALTTFVPSLANLPILTWIGLPELTRWKWTLRLALSYVGQGMIMGSRSAFSLLLGAGLAWGLLGPMARSNGWASGPITSWRTGAQGWVLWLSIALMLGESLSSFVATAIRQATPSSQPARKSSRGQGNRPSRGSGGGSTYPHPVSGSQACANALTNTSWSSSDEDTRPAATPGADPIEVAPPSQLVPARWWGGGLALSSALAVATISPMFQMPVWQVSLAVAVSCLVAVLAVRALGETDLNPVSAVGKISQIIFAVVAPGHVVANIVAGALAEAGAMQAGDLLQDLKTGHLLRASPRAQFFSQLIGATFSVFVTVLAYNLYDFSYGVPSQNFGARTQSPPICPTAVSPPRRSGSVTPRAPPTCTPHAARSRAGGACVERHGGADAEGPHSPPALRPLVRLRLLWRRRGRRAHRRARPARERVPAFSHLRRYRNVPDA